MQQFKDIPTLDDKYFIVKAYGGYSPCIQGNTAYGLRPFVGSVLPNCVGAATGAFNETADEPSCKWLGNTNAKNFIALAKRQGLEIGMTPRPGCIMVWSSAGAGHVAFCNDCPSDIKALTWESGWSYRTVPVENVTRYKGNGNWGQSSAYEYIGSIYNPAVNPYHTPRNVKVIKRGMSGDAVRWLQWALLREKCYTLNTKSQIDGHFGSGTLAALKRFQRKNGLEVDGYCGPATQAKIVEKYTLGGWY